MVVQQGLHAVRDGGVNFSALDNLSRSSSANILPTNTCQPAHAVQSPTVQLVHSSAGSIGADPGVQIPVSHFQVVPFPVAQSFLL